MASKKRFPKIVLNAVVRHYVEVTSRVVVITVGTMVVFGVPAYYLDKMLGTFPWILVVALIIALPFSQFLIYRSVKRVVSRRFNSKNSDQL